ncbi:hypothetical protein JCM10450v2_003193 [Rhodotorula kratochvilovae]
MAQHSPPGSPTSLEAPSPAQPRPLAPQHQPARNWAEPTVLPPLDPTTAFSFAPGPGASARGVGGSSGGGAAGKTSSGTRGARTAFVPGQAASSTSARPHASAGQRGELSPLVEEDDDDSPDEVVLAQAKLPAKDPTSPSPRGSTGAYDPLASFRLPALGASPIPAIPRGAKCSISETIAAPDPGDGMVYPQQPAPSSSAAPKPFHPPSASHPAPGGLSHGLRATAPAPPKPAERDKLPPAAPAPGGTSKKRGRAGETSAPAPAAGKAASQSQSQVQQPGGRGKAASWSKNTGAGGSRSTSAKTGEGEDVPDGKRRKSDPSVDSKDVVQHIMKLDEELKSKETTILRIRDRLERRDADLAKVTEEKRKLKEELLSRVRAALDSAASMQQELADAKAAMDDSFRRLKQEMGTEVTATEVRAELADLKEEFSAHVLDEKNELWLERFEDRKLEVLKSLQAELVKRQDVIDFLRANLDAKAGALAESRAHAQDLEARVDAAQARADALHRQVGDVDALHGEKAALMEKYDRVLVEGAEREEAHAKRRAEAERAWEERIAKREEALRGAEEKLEKGAEREETLREEWIKAKKEATARGSELVRAQERVKEVEKKQVDDAHTVELLIADLAKVRAELSDEIEHSKARLVSARGEFDVEKAILVERVEQVKAASADELADAKAKLAQLVDDHKKALLRAAEEAKAVEAAHQAQLVEAQQREATVSRNLEEMRAALRALEGENTSLAGEKAALQAKLDAALSTGSTVDDAELRTLRSQVAQLKKENEALAAAKRQTEESRRGIAESHNRLKLDGEAQTALVAQLQRELASAQAQNAQLVAAAQTQQEREQREKEEREAQEKERAEQAVKERQQAAAAALQQGKEFGQRELLQKGNELKRANNKLEELTKKHNRALNELAKAKARPILDPHIASSSTQGDPSPQHIPRAPPRTNGATAHTRISAVAPSSSDLTALDSDESPGGAAAAPAGRTKPKPKAVKFDVPPDAAAPPTKPRRRAPSTAGTGGAPAKPVKKVAAAAQAGKARRRAHVYGDAQEEEEEDGDRTLVEEDAGKSFEQSFTLVDSAGVEGVEEEREEAEDDDEIVDSNTPLPLAVSKPKPRTTYASSSSKKRR